MSLQGLESIAIHGRFGDTTVGHLSAGEMVLPKPIAHDPVLRRALFDAFQRHDTDPNRYTVGHYENSINPLTGVPEFGWFKKLGKSIKKKATVILNHQAVLFFIIRCLVGYLLLKAIR